MHEYKRKGIINMNIQATTKIESGIKLPAKWETVKSSPGPAYAVVQGSETTDADQNGAIYNSGTGVVNKSQTEENVPVSMEALKESVEDVEKAIKGLNSRIAIKINEETETPVVQFIDKESGEVIRQLPPEDMLKLRASFQDMLKGLFFNKEA